MKLMNIFFKTLTFSCITLIFGTSFANEPKIPNTEFFEIVKFIEELVHMQYDKLQQVIDKEGLFPFASNPTLSWNEFESDLRKEYAHLNIPPIKVTNKPFEGPCYHLDRKAIYCNPTCFSSPALAASNLLHETGHAHYPENLRKQDQQKAQAKTSIIEQRIDRLSAGATNMLYGLQAGLTGTNAYKLLRYKPHTVLLLAQGAVMALTKNESAFIKKITDKLKNTAKNHIDQSVGKRPEEYWADDFSNKYATKEALLAAQESWSRQGVLRLYKDEIISLLKNDGIALDIIPEPCMKPLVHIIYTFSGLLDPTHPSFKQRHTIATQALKNRFGVTGVQ